MSVTSWAHSNRHSVYWVFELFLDTLNLPKEQFCINVSALSHFGLNNGLNYKYEFEIYINNSWHSTQHAYIKYDLFHFTLSYLATIHVCFLALSLTFKEKGSLHKLIEQFCPTPSFHTLTFHQSALNCSSARDESAEKKWQTPDVCLVFTCHPVCHPCCCRYFPQRSCRNCVITE